MDSFFADLPPDLFDQTTLVSLASTVAILAIAYAGSRAVLPASTPASYRGLFIWHAFDALIHFCLEGSFLYHCFFSWVPLSSVKNPLALAPTAHNFLGYTNRAYGPQAAGDNPFAQLWMVYAKADKRWAGADLVRWIDSSRAWFGHTMVAAQSGHIHDLGHGTIPRTLQETRRLTLTSLRSPSSASSC